MYWSIFFFQKVMTDKPDAHSWLVIIFSVQLRMFYTIFYLSSRNLAFNDIIHLTTIPSHKNHRSLLSHVFSSYFFSLFSNRVVTKQAWSFWTVTNSHCWPCKDPVLRPYCSRSSTGQPTCQRYTSWTRSQPRSAVCRTVGSPGAVTRAKTVSRYPCHPIESRWSLSRSSPRTTWNWLGWAPETLWGTVIDRLNSFYFIMTCIWSSLWPWPSPRYDHTII